MQGKWLRKPTIGAAVVFVHGFLSNHEACWTHENKSYWPRLIEMECALEGVGIYAYSYQTDIFSGSYRLGDVVDDLKERMRLDHVLDCNRLVFVCHSMGGVVIRRFLVERYHEIINLNISVGLFLLASPSLGSRYASQFSVVAKIFGNSQAQVLRFSQNNAWLNDLDKDFQNIKESGEWRIAGKELVEDKFIILKRLWLRQVVEPFSGARYFGDPYKVPCSDHFSIAKPAGSSSIQHRLLCQFIADFLKIEWSDGDRPALLSEINQVGERNYSGHKLMFFVRRNAFMISAILLAMLSCAGLYLWRGGLASTGLPAAVGGRNAAANVFLDHESTVLITSPLDKEFFSKNKGPIFNVSTDEDCSFSVDGKGYGVLHGFSHVDNREVRLRGVGSLGHVYIFECRSLTTGIIQGIRVVSGGMASINFSLRYKSIGDNVLLDIKTGRNWSRGNREDISFVRALAYCKDMGLGWHLPSHNEILTLDLGPRGPFGSNCDASYSYINGACPSFYESGAQYWSSTYADNFRQKVKTFYSSFAGWDQRSISDAKNMRAICIK